MKRKLRSIFFHFLLVGCVLLFVVLFSKLDFNTRVMRDDPHFRRFLDIGARRNETKLIPFSLDKKLLIDVKDDFLNQSNNDHLFILVLVTSSVKNFKARKIIRETWASSKNFHHTKLKAVFLLGATRNDTLQKMVEKESSINNDILQNSYIDSYRNLTFKITSGLSWAWDHKANISWFAKIDDDVQVNPFQLKKFLEAQDTINKIRTTHSIPNTIYGRLRPNSRPFRVGKYIVSTKEYPYSRYPRHVLGSAYILGRSALGNIVKNMIGAQFLWLEDVFVTGLVAKRAKVLLQNIEIEHFVTKGDRRFYKGARFFCVGCKPKLAKIYWNKITNYNKVNS